MTYLTLRRPARNPFKFYSPFFAPLRAKTDAGTDSWAPSVDISETDEFYLTDNYSCNHFNSNF